MDANFIIDLYDASSIQSLELHCPVLGEKERALKARQSRHFSDFLKFKFLAFYWIQIIFYHSGTIPNGKVISE